MVGILVSFSDGPFSGATLVSGRVDPRPKWPKYYLNGQVSDFLKMEGAPEPHDVLFEKNILHERQPGGGVENFPNNTVVGGCFFGTWNGPRGFHESKWEDPKNSCVTECYQFWALCRYVLYTHSLPVLHLAQNLSRGLLCQNFYLWLQNKGTCNY